MTTMNDGGLDAEREKLIIDHIEFVENLVARFIAELPAGVDQDNLESSAKLGLVEAARNFDRSRGVSFTTFAYPRIRGAIFDELRRNCPIPQRILKNISLIRASVDHFDPSMDVQLIMEKTGLELSAVQECLRAVRMTRQESWEAQGYSRSVCTRSQSTPEKEFEDNERHAILTECIEQLPDRQEKVIRLYYLEGMLLREIGDQIHVSESRASRILSGAEDRLREIMLRRWHRDPPILSSCNLDVNLDVRRDTGGVGMSHLSGPHRKPRMAEQTRSRANSNQNADQ